MLMDQFWRSFYLHDVLRMCLHASLPVFPSPCCRGWQSELSTSFCQLIPSGIPASHLSPQGISTGPNSSCRWDSCRWCPSPLGIVQPPSPAVVAQQIFPFLSNLLSSSNMRRFWHTGSLDVRGFVGGQTTRRCCLLLQCDCTVLGWSIYHLVTDDAVQCIVDALRFRVK
jgi:hypothetical protein